MSNELILRQATAADAEALAALRVAAMRESLERIGRFDPERARERFLRNFDAEFTRHIEVAGTRVGFLVVRPADGGLLLDHLYLHPQAQSRGTGSQVLRRVFAEADARGLQLRVGALRESAANRFYLGHGFELVREEEFDILYSRSPRGGEVELLSYDAQWPQLFEREADRLRSTLDSLDGASIEHVGSTSVPGMRAKPFVDMLAVVAGEGQLAAVVHSAPQIAYHYIPEAEAVVPERRFFRRIDATPGYHLHVVARGAPLGPNLIAFRDALRADPTLARGYLELKSRLAASHLDDVEAYTTAKGPFIEATLQHLRSR